MDPSAIAIDVDYGTGWTHVMLAILFAPTNRRMRYLRGLCSAKLANFLDFFSIFTFSLYCQTKVI
jgi:hypothetical protein